MLMQISEQEARINLLKCMEIEILLMRKKGTEQV